QDQHYICINDATSTYPDSINLTVTKTDPTWSDTYLGWYVGNNRCIGSVFNSTGTATIYPFVTYGDKILFDDFTALQLNGTADNSWRATSTAENVVTPVFAHELFVRLINTDVDSVVGMFIRAAGRVSSEQNFL